MRTSCRCTGGVHRGTPMATLSALQRYVYKYWGPANVAQMHRYACTHRCVHTHACTGAHVLTCMNAHTYTHLHQSLLLTHASHPLTRIHMYTDSHTHAHTHTHIYSLSLSLSLSLCLSVCLSVCPEVYTQL